MENMQPGQVISPRTDPPSSQGAVPQTPQIPLPQPVVQSPPPPPAPPAESSAPVVQPIATASMPSQAAPMPVPTPFAAPTPPQPQAPLYTGVLASQAQDEWQQPYEAKTNVDSSFEGLRWSAHEFTSHDKATSWYLMLGVAAVLIVALVYVVSKDLLSTAVVLLTTIIFGVYASRKPRQQDYEMGLNGLRVGSMTYDFHAFKAFSVVDEGQNSSVILLPMKRFMPALTLYVPHDQEGEIVDFLINILPQEQYKSDALDSLLRKIRF